MRTLSAAAVQQLGVSSSQRLSRSDSGSAPKATQDNGGAQDKAPAAVLVPSDNGQRQLPLHNTLSGILSPGKLARRRWKVSSGYQAVRRSLGGLVVLLSFCLHLGFGYIF